MKVPFNETNRLIFIERRDGFFGNRYRSLRTIAFYVVLLCGIGGVFLGYSHLLYQKGMRDGVRQALDTRTPSEALELACAGLWVGKQNQKYWDGKY